MSSHLQYNQMFDYLRTVPNPAESAGLLVFGREDPLVAQAAGRTVMQGLGDYVVFTGGVGKDSGDLAVPESVYLADEYRRRFSGLHAPVYTEERAANGGENVRLSLDLMDRHGLPYQNALTTVAHATSSRRLNEMARHESIQRGTPIVNLAGVSTDYPFDPTNPADQQEAEAELLRLHQWPGKNWLQPQSDVPQNLVDFAIDQARARKQAQ